MTPPKHPQNVVIFISARKALVKKVAALFQSGLKDRHLQVVETGLEGLTQIYQSPPGLIVIDGMIPDISGLQLCRVLKHDPSLRLIPILLITKDPSEDHQRFTELSFIADAFILEKDLEDTFLKEAQSALTVFKGLEASEMAHIRLLQQDTVQVQTLKRLIQLLDQSVTEATVMKAFRKLLEQVGNKNILLHVFFNLLDTLLDYDVAGVFFNDKSRGPRLITYDIQDDQWIKEQQLLLWTQQVFEDLQAQSTEPWLFRETQFETISPIPATTANRTISLKHKAVFPFFLDSTLVGALVFFNRKEIDYELIFPFSLILEEMSAMMRLRHYYSQAEMLSMCDALTGLYTHQHFLWCLSREIRQAKRYQMPLTLAIISVDNLRQLNAQWGYELGDHVMKAYSKLLLQTMRSVDLMARSGGRTVLVLFSNTSPRSSISAIERIQELLLNTPLEWENRPIEVGFSIGAAGLSATVHTATEFIVKAQKAVDEARQKANHAVQIIP